MIQEVGYSIFFLMHILLIFLFNLSTPTCHRITMDLPEVVSRNKNSSWVWSKFGWLNTLANSAPVSIQDVFPCSVSVMCVPYDYLMLTSPASMYATVDGTKQAI